jgi:hypothetical protein
MEPWNLTTRKDKKDKIMKIVWRIISAAALAALAGAGAYAQTYTVYTVNGNPTSAAAINTAGTVTGLYDEATVPNGPLVAHGYVRTSDGKITTFDPTGSTGTHPTSINDSGTITGYFTVGAAQSKAYGFVRDAAGTITSFAPSGVTVTFPYSINNSGVITGTCKCSGGSFERGPKGGIKLISVENYVMFAYAISAVDEIVGSLESTTDSAYIGFALSPKDKGTTIPGTVGVAAINASGVITGQLPGSSGFVREPKEPIVAFTPPGSTYTTPAAINSAGTVAGTFLDSGQYSHGFSRDSAGNITVFDSPTLGEPYTYISGINSAGVMCGSSDEGAFILTP